MCIVNVFNSFKQNFIRWHIFILTTRLTFASDSETNWRVREQSNTLKRKTTRFNSRKSRARICKSCLNQFVGISRKSMITCLLSFLANAGLNRIVFGISCSWTAERTCEYLLFFCSMESSLAAVLCFIKYLSWCLLCVSLLLSVPVRWVPNSFE